MEINSSTEKYALVTGGTSGIGYELCRLLARDGYNLVVVARSNERLIEVCDELRSMNVKVVGVEKDLSFADAAIEIFNEIQSKGISINILVNNAAQGQHGFFHELPLDRHLEIIQLNIASVVALTHLCLREMVSRNQGRILNLASVVSKTPAPEFSIYAASKAFVLSFSEALTRELQNTKITVTALMPGRTDTAFFDKADMEHTKEYQDYELADPAEVAKDGYDALMRGEARIISGAKNKMMVGMMNSMPDSANAAYMQKNAQPTEKDADELRKRSEHPASEKERESVGKNAN